MGAAAAPPLGRCAAADARTVAPVTTAAALSIARLPAADEPGDDVLDVLAPAFGYPDLAARRHRARQTVADAATVVGSVDGEVVAAACVTLADRPAGHGRLDAIAVRESARDRGIGRELVRRVVTVLDLVELQAEADLDAVGFYRRLGFTVVGLGEQHPGTERFACTLTVR